MKRKILPMVFISIILIILIVGTVFFLKDSNQTFPSELSYATSYGGFSPSGVVQRYNEAPYIRFMDFASTTEVSLGADPQSTDDDMNSFAYNLNNTSAELINIYNKKLYYVSRNYEYDRKEPYSIVVYESSLDGGKIKTIGEFIGYSSCIEYYIADGFMFLFLEKYDEETIDSSIISNNMRNITVTVGCIDIAEKKATTLPDKTGYGAQLLYVGYDDGVFNYLLTYQTEAIDVPFEDDDAWKTESFKKVRKTVFSYDVHKQEETVWSDEFADRKAVSEDEFIYFRQEKERLYVTTYLPAPDSSGNNNIQFISYDSKSKQKLNEFEVLEKDSGTYNPNLHGEVFIFTKIDEADSTKKLCTAIDGSTGKTFSITELANYAIQEIIGDKLFLAFEDSNADTQYAWVSMEDYLSNNIDGLHIFPNFQNESSNESTVQLNQANSYIIKDIEQRYPDKKVLVWLNNSDGLRFLTEDRLIAFNDKLVEKGSDFVLQMYSIDVNEGAIAEYYSQMKYMIESGEQVDLVFTGQTLNDGAADGISDPYMYAYQNELLMPLDEYLNSDAGLALYQALGENHWKSVDIDGKIYGLAWPVYGQTANLMVDKEVASRYNLDLTNITNDINSLVPILEQMKDEEYPVDFFDTLPSIMKLLEYEFISLPIALDAERGAFNLFEDTKCIDYLKTVRSLLEQGYINSDINADIGITPLTLPTTNVPDMLLYPDRFTQYLLPIAPAKLDTARVANGIAKTSQYPNECIQLLSWLYTDVELADLLAYGVEGVDYRLDEEGRVAPISEDGQISWELPWFLGFISNTTENTIDAVDSKQCPKYNEGLETTPIVGFHFNNQGLEDKLLELNRIVEKYTIIYEEESTIPIYRSFLTGHDSELTTTLASLNQDLKEAGLDELIVEVNRQFNNWKEMR